MSTGPAGYLGGTFDPVHRGHLQLGRDALAQLGLASITFVPAGDPWQKRDATPRSERLRMLEIALASFPGATIDRREIDRPGPTYTVDTLRALRAELGPEQAIVWILGEDQLRRLDTWSRWEDLFALAHVAHARRPGAEATLPLPVVRALEARRADAAVLRATPAGAVVEFPMQAVDCSATRIRRHLARPAVCAGVDDASGDADGGGFARDMLPPGVLEYILSRNLYGTGHGNPGIAQARH